MIAKGSFQVTMRGEPPYDDGEGVTLGRMTIDKVFRGPLAGASQVHMLAARTPVANSAGYVALERIRGTLDGRTGSFCVVHVGLMTRGAATLTVTIVPDSGTGDLSGIEGSMRIEITGGQHYYELDYTLPQLH